VENISEYLSQIKIDEKTIYRGHADRRWELKPSIGRHYSGKWSEVLEYEVKILETFKKKSVPYIKYNPKSDIEWLCLMQHHGCATRLLDFTSNPLIALFFASDPVEKADGKVVIAKYGRTYEKVNDDNLFERSNSFAYYPPHITERIVGQSGCFVYSKTPNKELSGKQIETITVPMLKKYQIRLELKSLGISHSSLFPGMDGVCKDLNDALIKDLFNEELPF